MKRRKVIIHGAAVSALCCMMSFPQSGSASDQQTPEGLARLWIEAIKTNSTAKIRPLVHPACPQEALSPEILARMVDGELPPAYVIETRELGPRSALERIYEVVPDLQLTIKYQANTPAEKAKYGLGKGFPIGKSAGDWFFVICTRSGG